MRVGVVLAGPVVMVLAGGFVGRKFLEPDFVIVVQPRLVVVDRASTADASLATPSTISNRAKKLGLSIPRYSGVSHLCY
jgi:hypothetical protein